MNDAISPPSEAAPVARVVNWPQVGMFVGLTFGLTWLLNLWLYLVGGLASPAAGLTLVTQMLIPAFSAILLETFVFSDSPLYFKVHHGPARWFTYFYLGMSVLAIIGAAVGLAAPGLAQTILIAISIIELAGLVVLLVARWRGGKDTFASVCLAGGKFRWWVIFALGMTGFYLLMTLLNMLFKLGTPLDIAKAMPQLAGLPPPALHGLLLLQILIITPLSNLLFFFGEEYGWRGFLQTALARMGRIRGTFLVGVIWGIWHAPVILMGYNYPENPLLGVLLMTLYCILLAYFLAYAVYKSQGVWTAAFLHGINNNVASYFFGILYVPGSVILSFGIGVYGLVCMAVVVLLLLRDPLWKER
ncbi:MAG: CPBP family intramembrane metalloprotease [Chloroflexi bacterium]|nr:MAG: CPBP family intramembrane metalloprotease [Chloroflexota bacterium]